MVDVYDEVANLDLYERLGKAIVARAVADYVRYLKAQTVKGKKAIKGKYAYDQIIYWGKSAERYLESKNSNRDGGIDMGINILQEVKKTYKYDKHAMNNYYYNFINRGKRYDQRHGIKID